MPPRRLLRPGQSVQLADTPGAATVVDFIGSGGQGEVYRASVFGHDAALKWYHPNYLDQDPGLWNRLERLVFSSPPSPAFVWPYARVGSPASGGLGYLMPLRRPNGATLHDLLYGSAERSFDLLTRVALHTSEQLRRLHLAGLCYRDLNPGNFCYDLMTGQIEVLDNDNVDVEGEAFAVGTVDFAAPEVLTGRSPSTRYTDLWSLAVLLFHIAVLQDPFVGEHLITRHGGVLDTPAMLDLHARPVFIFDPNTTSNAPLEANASSRVLWGCYPQALRTLFVRAFTTGIANPRARVTEAEWREAFLRAQDGLFACPNCGAQNIVDLDQAGATACFACTEPLSPALVLELKGRPIVLRPGACLYRHHLDRRGDCDLTQVIGKVSGEPLALLNTSGQSWTVQPQDGAAFTTPTGGAALLAAGMRLQFGGVTGTVAATGLSLIG